MDPNTAQLPALNGHALATAAAPDIFTLIESLAPGDKLVLPFNWLRAVDRPTLDRVERFIRSRPTWELRFDDADMSWILRIPRRPLAQS